MPSYQIHLTPSFSASLRELTKRYPRAQNTVNPALESLKQHPEAGVPFQGGIEESGSFALIVEILAEANGLALG